MNREEFMKELEYLLQDIPDEEKEDAIAYYRDYLEEAGEENEEDVLKEFGSPERIASVIRIDIAGNLDDGGEFTESGYQDERFKDPNFQIAKRFDLPEKKEDEDYRQAKDYGEEKTRSNKTLKAILWVILIIVASPIILGAGGALLGLFAGIIALLLGLFLIAGTLTLGFVIAGIALLAAGVVHMGVSLANGLLSIGLGIGFLGLSGLLMAFSIAFYGKFLPWLTVGIVNSLNRFFTRGRGRQAS